MFRNLHRGLILAGAALLLFVGVAGAQDEVTELFILEATNSYPQLVLNVRAVDREFRPTTTLTPADVEVFEDQQPVPTVMVAPGPPLPANIIFVIDFGQFSNYGAFDVEELRDSLRTYAASGAFRDGVDTVTILGRVNNGVDETVELLPPTQAVETFLEAVEQLRFARSTGSTRSLESVKEAVERLQNLTPDPRRRATAVIFLAHSVHLPPTSQQPALAQEIGLLARAQQTRVFAVHANREGAFDQPLRIMATESGGAYYRLSTSQPNAEVFRRLFQDVADLSRTFDLTFESQSGASGPRELAVIPAGGARSADSAVTTLNVLLEEPRVEITSYAPEIIREVDPDSRNLEPDFTEVSAVIRQWPYPLAAGDLLFAELLIQGADSILLPNPSPDGLRFAINIDGITTTQAIQFSIRVGDQKNIVGQSPSATINVVVDTLLVGSPCEIDPTSNDCRQEQLAAQATQAAFDAAEATRAAAETNLSDAEVALQTAEAERETARSLTRTVTIVSATIIVILLVLLIIFRRQLSSRMSDARTVIQQGGGALEVVRTILAGGSSGQTAIARLEVLNGPADLLEQTVDIYASVTTLGRNGKLSDILFYDRDANSSVSGEHCTIQYDLGQFLITDNNSTNGTTVNGERLVPNEPYKLYTGDEIKLGDLFRRGVKLRFEIIDQPESDPGAAAPAALDPAWEDAQEEGWRGDLLHETGENETLASLDQPLDFSWQSDGGEEVDDSWMDDLE